MELVSQKFLFLNFNSEKGSATEIIRPIKTMPMAANPRASTFRLNLDKSAEYATRLLTYFSEKEPFLDSELSLRSLADQIEIHPNQLSWLINEKLNKNFNEFVNHYRVEVFKRIAKDPKNAAITILGLTYDCGFNSKTVFNTYFKKETGVTPKQFLKE